MQNQWALVWDSLVATPFGLYSTWEQKLQAEAGLQALHFHVLQTLAEAPDGRMRLQDLAEAVRHSQSGTTRLVDRLESLGLVARHSCKEDRRVIWALLSEAGQATFRRALPLWEAFLADHLQKGLTPEEASQLQHLLAKLQRTLDPDAPTCPSLKA